MFTTSAGEEGNMAAGTIPELLEANLDDESINDLIVTIDHMADKAETHVAYQGGVPDYVSRAPRLREITGGLGRLRDEAAGGDRGKAAELKLLVETAKQAVV